MNIADLQKTLRRADESAVLVSSRILEKVIREDCRLPDLTFNIPHWKSYVCDRQKLFKHAEQVDLELDPDQLLPETVILLVRPEDEETSRLEEKGLLLRYWRMLFHSRVHLALGALDSGRLPDDAVRERVEAIGRTEFEEVRNVLMQDRYLPSEPDERLTYIEFAAVYLELRYFAPYLLPGYFPGIGLSPRVDNLLARDVDAAALFEQTRLRGAADPVAPAHTRSDESQEAYLKLVRAAQRAALSGNIVAAAIGQMRASRIAPAAETIKARREAENNIAQLTQRLASALQLGPEETADWTRHLSLLLDKADQGARPMEARVLEDIQKVCLDEEEQVYTLDLVEFLMSGGKRPIKRPLPSQKLVRITSHLRAALQKLGEVRLADEHRDHLGRLLQGALNRSEERLRARFAPVLITAMADVGLVPANPIEKAAFDKMVGELLDRISRYGYLTFGELRDTISRNQFKLGDVTEPEQFIRGDPLIRLDRRLGALLDGVYRPGEFYVRYLEQGMSLLFATWWGRPVCRYVLLPFGVAWLILHILGMFLLWAIRATLTYEAAPILTDIAQVIYGPEPYEAGMPAAPYHQWAHWGVLLATGVFLAGLFQVPTFRHRCYRVVIGFWRGLRRLVWDIPLRLIPLETIRRMLGSWFFRLVYWYLLRPGGVCVFIYLFFPRLFHQWWSAGLTFLIAAYVTSAPLGVVASETVIDTLVHFGRLIRAGLLPGLVRFILQLFKQIVDAVEYVLFLVDEWLRFRSGDSRTSLVVRTILGFIWFPIAFFARFYMVVLIEPMLNPIKFPITSLAAKIMYPVLYGSGLDQTLIASMREYTGNWFAWAFVQSTFFLMPDAAAFLVWEMRENWRLYRANRSPVLRPTVVGAHGETIRGLLQPGFHSGTVPHVFAHLRKAERRAARTGNWHAARAYRHEIDEIAVALRAFLDREMVALLRQSRSWQAIHLESGQIHVSTNRLRFELCHGEYPDRSVLIDIEHHNYWVVASIHDTGWLDRLSAEQLRAFTTCLAGLYKRADVDLVREQLLASVQQLPSAAKLTYEGLLVWKEPHGPPTRYILRDGLEHPDREPELDRLVFSRWPITWEQWIECWKKDQLGEGHPGLPGLGELLVRLPQPLRDTPIVPPHDWSVAPTPVA